MILQEKQNQNDADDANDAESGIWYRDILKTASQASSASLSSRKSSEGGWGTPQKCVCGYPNAMLAKHVYPKTMTNKPDTHTNPYIPQSESTVDSLKIFNSSEWINDRFTLPTEAKCRKNPANSPRVNQFRFIQKSWLEKMNQFWFTLQLELVLQNEEKSLVYGLFLCRTH